jgi:hypothetical protein
LFPGFQFFRLPVQLFAALINPFLGPGQVLVAALDDFFRFLPQLALPGGRC